MKNEAHFFVSKTRLRGGAAIVEIAAFKFDCTGFRPLQACQSIKQSCFSSARSAADENDIAVGNIERDPAQDLNTPRAHSKRLEQIAGD